MQIVTKLLKQSYLPILIFGMIGALGLIMVLVFTPWGIGVSHDSVYYLDAAENVLAGSGLRWRAGGGELRPLTHYPPMYSLILAAMGLSGIDLVEGARLIAAVLFALNLMVIAWLIYRHTQSLWPTIAASAVALFSPILLDVHLMALTEPLFLLLLLAVVAATSEYLLRKEMRFLIAAGVLVSLANLTRYAGLSLSLTCFLALVLLGAGRFRQRFLRAVLFSTLTLAPLIGWNLRNQMLAGTTVGRVFSFHPIAIEKLKLGARALLLWLLPEETPFRAGMVIFSIVLISFAAIVARKVLTREKVGLVSTILKDDYKRLTVLAILFVLVYGLFLVLSLTFVDASTPLDVRILSPAYLMMMVAVFTLVGGVEPAEGRSRLSWYVLLGLGALLFVSYVGRSAIILKTMREEGRGFNARKWDTSELIVKVKEMDEDVIIYSSDALHLYFLTGRSGYPIPQKLNPVLDAEREEYLSDLELMRSRLKEPGAALVLFSESFDLYRPELPKIEEVVEGLVLYWNTRHGVIYIDPVNAEQP